MTSVDHVKRKMQGHQSTQDPPVPLRRCFAKASAPVSRAILPTVEAAAWGAMPDLAVQTVLVFRDVSLLEWCAAEHVSIRPLMDETVVDAAMPAAEVNSVPMECAHVRLDGRRAVVAASTPRLTQTIAENVGTPVRRACVLADLALLLPSARLGKEPRVRQEIQLLRAVQTGVCALITGLVATHAVEALAEHAVRQFHEALVAVEPLSVKAESVCCRPRAVELEWRAALGAAQV